MAESRIGRDVVVGVVAAVAASLMWQIGSWVADEGHLM